jgi:hypothetical protein
MIFKEMNKMLKQTQKSLDMPMKKKLEKNGGRVRGGGEGERSTNVCG